MPWFLWEQSGTQAKWYIMKNKDDFRNPSQTQFRLTLTSLLFLFNSRRVSASPLMRQWTDLISGWLAKERTEATSIYGELAE